MSGGEQAMFWLLAPAAVLGALGLLFARKAVHAAMAMALVMIVMGIFYIGQHETKRALSVSPELLQHGQDLGVSGRRSPPKSCNAMLTNS